MQDEITWDAKHNYLLNGQVMEFRRLPKAFKRVVNHVFTKGFERYEYETEEMIENDAIRFDISIGDMIACINYAQKQVDKLNLWDC